MHNKKGKARQFDMHSRKELEEESEETVTEKEESENSSDQTSSEEDSQISLLLKEPDSCIMQMEEIQEKKEESKLEDMDQLMQPPLSQPDKEKLMLSMLNSAMKSEKRRSICM